MSKPAPKPTSPKAQPTVEKEAPKGDRLQKILAQAGIASRRAAEQIILDGRVIVNGQVVIELGTRADLAHDHVRVDGKLLHGPEPTKYYMVNKPRGYVTTLDDPEHRPTVMQLLGEDRQKKQIGEHSKFPRLYPVGRLDYLSEGLEGGDGRAEDVSREGERRTDAGGHWAAAQRHHDRPGAAGGYAEFGATRPRADAAGEDRAGALG
jgi:hypothetical protein